MNPLAHTTAGVLPNRPGVSMLRTVTAAVWVLATAGCIDGLEVTAEQYCSLRTDIVCAQVAECGGDYAACVASLPEADCIAAAYDRTDDCYTAVEAQNCPETVSNPIPKECRL